MCQSEPALKIPRAPYNHELFEDAIVSEKMLDRFRADGTAWAYHLAESVVLNCRTHGLFGFHIPMGFARAWQIAILRWPEDVVAEVKKWRETSFPPNVKVPAPQAVMALVEEATAYILGMTTASHT